MDDRRGVAHAIDPTRTADSLEVVLERPRWRRLHHILEPFYTTQPPGAGNGLGLTSCHDIVTSLGGSIEDWRSYSAAKYSRMSHSGQRACVSWRVRFVQ